MTTSGPGPDDGYFALETHFEGPIPEDQLPPEARSGGGPYDAPDAVTRVRKKRPTKTLKGSAPNPTPKPTSKPGGLKPAAKPPAKPASKPPSSPNWQRELTLTARGAVASSPANAVTILKHDAAWTDALAYDDFAGRVMKLRPIKWHRFDKPAKQFRKPGPWTDLDTSLLRNWFEREHELLLKMVDVAIAVDTFSRSHLRSGPRDYLRALTWDNVQRLDEWLITYGGAGDSRYSRAVGAMWMISAVARAFQPGCQVDHTVIFEGDQGIGKSSLLRVLCPDKAWFLIDIGSEFGKLDSFQKLRGKWIVEMSELDGLGRSALAAAKAYMTATIDSYRKSYGRETEDHPRRCVFAGTTNKEEYLVDETGNRRFWPVALYKIDLARLKADRDQLWAEAVARYRLGEEWHITDPALLELVKKEQQKRVQSHPWERLVAEHLQLPDVQTAGVTALEILLVVLKMRPRDITPSDEIRVTCIVKKMGWFNPAGIRKRVGKHRVRRFYPPPEMGSDSIRMGAFEKSRRGRPLKKDHL